MPDNQLKCPKCNKNYFVKNGNVHGLQRYKCKNCGFNFTQTTDLNKLHPLAKSLELREIAINIYLKGNSFRDIAEILNYKVTWQSISRWVKKRGLKSNKK